MDYKQQILEECLALIQEKRTYSINEIRSYYPGGSRAFDGMFPPGSDEREKMKDIIAAIKTEDKIKLRRQMQDSDIAALKIAAYKLAADEDELVRLTKTYSENVNKETLTATIMIEEVKEDLMLGTSVPSLAHSENEIDVRRDV